MHARQAHAFIRFGLGRRGVEPVPDDPKAWLAGQLAAADPLLASARPDTAAAFASIRDYVHGVDTPERPSLGSVFQRDAADALAHAIATDLPFRERLVWFWTNHFCVSARRGSWVLALLGPFVREAIRPHVTGRFGDMLRAVMHHPGMLDYLDNLWSAGPHSEEGSRLGLRPNENLARECLELHTVGVDAGYRQADVQALASMLTGWTVAPVDDAVPGFRFSDAKHEPGEKPFLGLSHPEGLAGAEMALMRLAAHPATGRHIARKLARHFIADDPPEDAVDRLARVFHETGGDLRAVALALLDIDAAWRPLTKQRAPLDYVVAIFRALELDPSRGQAPAVLVHILGQPFWAAPLPNGWPDVAAAWSGGEATLRRADLAFDLAVRAPAAGAERVGETALGVLFSERTRAAIRAAETQREALALLLASPEFQRR